MNGKGHITTAAERREASARRALAHARRRAYEASLSFEEWLAFTGYDPARVIGSDFEADLRDDHARIAR